MRYLPSDDSNVNPIDLSADLTAAHEHRSASFAAEAVHSAFGRRYPVEGHDGFIDRAPGEIAILRAARFGRRRVAAWRS